MQHHGMLIVREDVHEVFPERASPSPPCRQGHTPLCSAKRTCESTATRNVEGEILRAGTQVAVNIASSTPRMPLG